jgi:hypothetical protein
MRCFWIKGSREEDLMALVTRLVMVLIGFLLRVLYVEEERRSINLES